MLHNKDVFLKFRPIIKYLRPCTVYGQLVNILTNMLTIT